MHVSIIGSCLLRDIFNSKFVPNYAEKFIVDSYFARTTIPSMMSKAYDYDINVLEKCFNPLKFEYHYTECAKCMLSILENNCSDYLLLDFYADSYYGTFEYEQNFYGGWSFKRLMKLDVIDSKLPHKLYNFEHNVEEYFEIWCESFDQFMEYAREHLSATKIIINGIKGSNQITENGNVIGIQQPKVDIQKLNDLWTRMDQYGAEKYNIPIIHYEKKYTLNPNYIYGLNHEFVHFHPEYYTDAFSKLAEICTEENNKLLSHNNLVRNSGFEEGLRFWSFSNSAWSVKKHVDKAVLVPAENSNCVWKSIWSDPIEINGNGETSYTLSFTINVKEKVLVEPLVVFGVRTFKKAVYKKYQDSIFSDLVSIPVDEMQYNTNMRITYTFKPMGKFIRIAPHVKQDVCAIEFSEVQLEKGEYATPYKPAFDDKNV